MKIAPHTLDLVRKYNQPGPRYTSYPTALQFTPEVDRTALVADAAAGKKPLSLYFHLPFCESLCWFCGCTTVITLDRKLADQYLDYLEKEMALMAPILGEGRSVAQLHFGGGSPSFLEPAQIRRLGHAIHRYFKLEPDAECGVELDPRTLNEEKVVAFKEIGFNRASMGVQDCNPEVQQAIHRIQPREMNVRAFDWLRQYGYGSVNIDLIYGLPKQTLDTFRATLHEVLQYTPDRFAVFSYAHVPWMKPAQKILERHELPIPETKLALLGLIIETLTEAGYDYIGMDHFAKHQDELAVSQRNKTLHRNFQGYSTRAGLDIAAFGMSAISETAGTYRQNFKELPDYYAAIDQGKHPIERGYVLTAEDLRRRDIIMHLMCMMELNYAETSQRIGVDFASTYAAELASLDAKEADGLVVRGADSLKVTESGRLLIRNIAMHFDAYLQSSPQRHSKTI
ncbi:MAG: oxygen-independent coproporphyrinogen III oxidase [Verrucomicrobiota bacterium]|nr:oxygen-independent coproporphyrinogen III oxidase [Verrucomicrobiota bacterium]